MNTSIFPKDKRALYIIHYHFEVRYTMQVSSLNDVHLF